MLVEGIGDELILEYYGDLPEAEIVGQSIGEIEAVSDYSLAWIGSKSVCMILTIEVEVSADVQYEDRSLAMYDREDDRWFGADISTVTILSRVPIELFVEFERSDFRVITSELLRTEYSISESYDWSGDDHGFR